MSVLLLYLVVVLTGYFVGYYCRKKIGKKIPHSSTIQMIMIYINVIFVGMRIGIREEIINNIFTIGISSFIFTFFILLFAVISTSIGRKILGFNKYGERIVNDNQILAKVSETYRDIKENKNNNSYYKMTIILFISAFVGIAIGYLVVYKNIKQGLIFDGSIEKFEVVMANVVNVIVSVLIFLVGVDLGFDKKTIGNIKKAGLLILVFPIFNIIGTTTGAIVATFICNIKLYEGITIGEGYSWFSIAPGLCLQYGLVEVAAISFLHNVLREILSFVLVPIVAKKVGYIETICLAGAAAMDDGLPIIEKSTTPVVAIYGFVSGVILTMLVPSLTILFATMATAR